MKRTTVNRTVFLLPLCVLSTKEELGNPAGDGATIIGGIAFALVCALMGVRSMRKAKREG